MYRIQIHYYAEIIKIRNSLFFSLFTWYQSQERKPNFLGDRVSFRSPSPPPDLPLTTAAKSAAAVRRRHCRRRLPGKLFSGRKPHRPKRRGPIYTPVASPPETDLPRAVTRASSPAASPSTRRRVSARVGAWILLR